VLSGGFLNQCFSCHLIVLNALFDEYLTKANFYFDILSISG